jgi:hypothetical protein
MFRSLPFKPFFLCDLPDAGILFEDRQSLQQRMFLLDRASQSRFTLACWLALLSPRLCGDLA